MADGSTCGASVWGGYIADLREQRRRWTLATGRDPDAIRLRIRRIDREIVHAAIQLAMVARIDPPKRNCKPPPNPKPKTCPICQTTYPKAMGHFGPGGTRTRCQDCQGKPAIKSKTCRDCGTEYLGVQEHFRRGGKIHPNCNACAEAKVRAKIEARLAKRGRHV
jgi:hypothetical protein